MIKKITLKISGMHCTSCAMNIDGELEDLGVTSASTNYAKAETVVEYDETKTQLSEIQKVIQDLGYSTQSVDK